ncbi:RagB/SusD family nutrient uptake outer membrane protein [Solitalea canadensis]|uniref:RagB/SusD family protein n=1 Tax=Solitalea canadensis (strain ATCC 29591 / DSM 3403 / JCM 21819 / LMG 8368 / NBRC 15130 / NCIMB 12057 / USAM 9D) TaxID=929556 RepID=H8KPX4_SOLCM|nr:RagB/SusD family nutrient uptake outer membrane protein [Solitalea canadensis]AFD06083.1 RagB/SusD family protein [Solitalea canadensis DSM 3403]
MKLIRLATLLIVPSLLLGACSSFLDVKPKGVIIAETISDYDGLLNDVGVINPFGQSICMIYTTDDVKDVSFSPQNQTAPKGNSYFWREYINNNNDRPDVWADFYNRIANLNVITEGVLSASDGAEQQKKQLYAEAAVAKAFNYFYLLSFFSPAYSKSTAEADYGVPYVISTDQSKATPQRPSLQQSLDDLTGNILAAIPDLPNQNINNSRFTKASAYGLLTRIYLYMGNYTDALKYADLVLRSGDATILNYNNFSTTRLPHANNSPEELLVRYCNNMSFHYSDELLSVYNLPADLRIQLLATPTANGGYDFGGGTSYNPNRGISYAEIYLTKAECLARNGDINGALAIVNNTIRKNRMTPAGYTALTAANKEEAITAVLEERRRELAFKGMRWSDMKRLDKDGRMKPVMRYAADGTVLVTLTPGSTNYTFQIPLQVQAFNAGMPLNKR